MQPNAPSQTIQSIEELTLYALDRSAEGIAQLSEACRQCGAALELNPQDGLSKLAVLAETLNDFDQFQQNLMSFFLIDKEQFRDLQGSLTEAEAALHATLNGLPAQMERGDYVGLAQTLAEALPAALARFHTILPHVKDFIHAEYVQPVA